MTKYSPFFKTKVGISFVMGVFDVVQFLMILALPQGAKHSGWVNLCSLNVYSLFYLFQATAWFYGTWLMIFEYRRLLSEAWYSHQLYWVLNLTIECVSVLLLIESYVKSPLMLSIACINIFANLCLVVLMFKTERRTLQNRRPAQGYDVPNSVEQKRRLL